ncbi:MAG TPA: pitrilysin family protein [Thermoanaerobaculia bacterium]|nr:pitrilysin family protein [Thermoanaerobaculia bacterium]
MSSPLDRSRPPAPGAARPARFPHFHRHRLDSGLEVYLLPIRRTPLVLLERISPAGCQEEPADLGGLATFTADLLEEGTARRSSREIAAQVEQLGGALGSQAVWDNAVAWIEGTRDQLPTALALLAEITASPSFPPEEIERARRERLAELARRRKVPGTLADLQLLATLYGERGAYGRSIYGDERSVSAIERHHLEEFFAGRYVAAGSALLAVGDFEPERLLRLLEEGLGGEPSPPAPPRHDFGPPPQQRRRVLVVDRPHAAQTELRLGRAGLCRFDPDYLPLRVATSLLGGRFTSRLNLRLREELGLTYSISASQAARRGPAPFQIQSAVASESVGLATRETLAALERLAAEPAGERELAETVDYLVGTFAFTLQGLRDLAQHLENLITFDLPDTYFDQLHLELRAITPEQTRQVAERWLQPSSMTVVAVGPAESLAPQLEDLGEVEVVSGG